MVAGQGKVYECLFKHKFDQRMSHKCRDALTTRQKVQALDFKVGLSLTHCVVFTDVYDAGQLSAHPQVQSRYEATKVQDGRSGSGLSGYAHFSFISHVVFEEERLRYELVSMQDRIQPLQL